MFLNLEHVINKAGKNHAILLCHVMETNCFASHFDFSQNDIQRNNIVYNYLELVSQY